MSTIPAHDQEPSGRTILLNRLQPDSELQYKTLKVHGDELLASYHTSHSLDVLEEAIGIFEEALQLRPMGHEHRAESLNDLGDALFHLCCYHKAEETRSIRCIELLREGLRLRPPGHPLRDQSLHNLAKSLGTMLYQQLGRLDIITECAALNREALQLRPLGHPERVVSLNNLANNIFSIYSHTGDTDSLAEAVIMRRAVLEMSPPGHASRCGALGSLSTSLRVSFENLGGSDTLAEAIKTMREAVELCPVQHPMRFWTLDSLASALALRCIYEGHSDSLTEGIDLGRQAIQLLSDSHPERARIMNNLAESLLNSFHITGDRHTLAEVLTLLRGVVTLKRRGDYYDLALESLATALAVKFDNNGDTEALSEAGDLHREALHFRPIGHPRRFWSLEGLARVLCRMESPSWPEALSCYQKALQACPVGYPARSRLLSGMSQCFLEPRSPFFSLSQGISCLSRAYADTLSHISGRLKSAPLDLGHLEAAYAASTKKDQTQPPTQDDERMLDLYTQVIGLLPLAANFGLNHSARLQALAGCDEVARNAAARAVHLGSLRQAIEMLEQGRGVFWTQTLHLRTTAFDGVPKDDCEELQHMLRLLDNGSRRMESQEQSTDQRERELDKRRQLNEAVQTLITKIRGYPGLDRFLLPPAFGALFGSLPDGFVVILNASRLAHHALLLHRATGLATSLALKLSGTDFDSEKLRDQLPRDMASVSKQEGENETRGLRRTGSSTRCFEDVLALLWTSAVQPVLDELRLNKTQGRARPRLWWCVTGQLGFLPIHAAGIYSYPSGVCTADYVVSSYIPTLASLTKARRLWTPIARSDLAGILICETTTAGSSMGYLSDVVDEAVAVRECFASAGARVLNQPSKHTTVSELRSLLAGSPSHVLHMACHGIQHSKPLKSSFVLQDGELSIEDIIQLDLPHAFLAFLSACQTAKGDMDAPDQAVHLAASMLFCGFRSVVGTMWSMCDKDGPKVARQFYSSLFARDWVDLDDIAYALDDAVQVLRESNVPASRWASFMHIGG